MLSNLNKNIFFGSVLIVFLSGCAERYSYSSYSGSSQYSSYSSQSGSSSSAKVTKRYSSSSSSKIKNSKAMQRATMRPYEVFGKKYYPTVARIDDQFRGIASWYGPNFHAKKTSNGEIYNMYANTAAHKTLPMNTVVKVDNLENGKSTIVRINDRGPFVSGRIIDLSNKAAHAIDMVRKGTARVKITVLGFHGKIATTLKEKSEVRSVGNYFIQVGVFARVEGAHETKRKFELILEDRYSVVLKDGIFKGKAVKRVWISGFRSENEARDFKANNNLKTAMIIAQ